MALISSLISDIRIMVSDKQSAEWEDSDILAMIKMSVERASHVLYRNGVQFAKTSSVFSTVVGATLYDLPSDFMAQDGLYRRDTKNILTFVSDDDWEQTLAAAEQTIWRVNGGQIEIAGTPTTSVSMALYYYPSVDTSAYATTTTMPWSGRMDQPIKEYVSIRLSNIDEMGITQDMAIMTDIFNHYLDTFTSNTPSSVTTRGWLPYA